MKKIVAIILCLVFVLSLTACGKNDTANGNSDTTQPTVSAITSTVSVPESENNETASSDSTIDFSDVSSFDDFVEIFFLQWKDFCQVFFTSF